MKATFPDYSDSFSRIFAICVLSLLFLSFFLPSSHADSNRRESFGEFKLFLEIIDGMAKNGVRRSFNELDKGIRNGLSFSDSVWRVGTLYRCQEKRSAICNDNYVVNYKTWEPYCHGDSDFCCIEEEIDCRRIQAMGAISANKDISTRDQRKLCIRAHCMPPVDCNDDTQCANYPCPAEPNGPEDAVCDSDRGKCYCASSCPDQYCDLLELIDGSCPADCPKLEGDSDHDGLSDDDERIVYGTDPKVSDTDKDGLWDGDEVRRGTDPRDPDTDSGGQCDGPATVPTICRMGPDPCPFDSNNECHISSGGEKNLFLLDTDNDGISDAVDPCPTHPENACSLGNDPPPIASYGDRDAWAAEYYIEDLGADDDYDRLTNAEEYAVGSDPLEYDTDEDALSDLFEEVNGPLDPDSDEDSDGLNNYEEFLLGLDPNNPDSDLNGLDDGVEHPIPADEEKIKLEVVDILPQDTRTEDGVFSFSYGQTVEKILVSAEYLSGKPLIRPTISGALIVRGGLESIPINFNATSATTYMAKPRYDLLQRNEEAPHITLEVFALDPFGHSANYTTRLYVSNIDESVFALDLRSPSRGQDYLFGQNVAFDLAVFGQLAPEDVYASVLVSETGDEFPLNPHMDNIIGSYLIDRDFIDSATFTIAAHVDISGVRYDYHKRIRLDISDKLRYAVVSEDHRSTRISVTYPNGDSLPYDKLSAEILDSEGNVLEKTTAQRSTGDIYSIQLPEGGDSLLLHIEDMWGNNADIELRHGSEGGGPTVDTLAIIFPPLLLFAALLIVLFFGRCGVGRLLSKRRELSALRDRRKQLKGLISDTKRRYYKKQMSEKDASERIIDYENELKSIESKLNEAKEKSKRGRNKRHGRRRSDKDKTDDSEV